MPSYTIEIRPRARKALLSIQADDRAHVVATIAELAANPRPYGYIKVQGKEGLLRVRWGDYRIIYEIENQRLVVCVVAIGNRREVYRF